MLWWDESLATGIEIIDEQHRSIFSKANEILSLEVSNVKKIREEFYFLINYASNHFCEEEKIMFNYYYDGFKDHRDKHTYFINELFNINLVLNKGEVTQEVLDNLKVLVIEWLADHINKDDKEFISTFKRTNSIE